MLLPQIQARWGQPDALSALIIDALNDDFVTDVECASAQLLAIDPNLERGHVIRAIVPMQLGKLDEAQRVLREAVAKVGQTATLLTNLAKVQDHGGHTQAADATLWISLTLDPNQDNGLGWWLARERERSGEVGYMAALERVRALPGSWRATLYLGLHRLADGHPDAAIGLLSEALAQSGSHRDALLAISGELGKAGRLAELIALVAPHYDPAEHGPQVGLNLLQAYLDLDRLDPGEVLLKHLYALNLPPFKQPLDAIAAQYQQRRSQRTPARPPGTLLVFDRLAAQCAVQR